MKHIVGTGLSGLIGSRFQALAGDQFEFGNLDLTTGVDITNFKQVNEAIEKSAAEVIIHLAAFTNVSAAFEQEGDKEGVCYQVNVVGTENIAKAAQKHHKYLIHISTDFVFDGMKDEPYTEEDIPNPIEWYGKTKFMAEETVKKEMDNYAILRLAYPYQARPARPDFLAGMREKLSQGTLPPAFADHVITPTFADDLAKVFSTFANARPQGIFHTVGSSWHTDYEIASMVKKAFDLGGNVEKGSLEAYLQTVKRPYQKTMKVSNAKLEREVGVKMKDLEAGLAEVRKQLA